ncbi:hypothetical protein [Spirosoma sp.]|uniref:hypothetical protein n=1 Tax=Spirosoma sp. TaxID=1899569 RepID=UPI0026151F00|nr:hypothetical protein [Spirosoma sp.]MCX6214888.1 hypothetical protein [Spirosoma sp.]
MKDIEKVEAQEVEATPVGKRLIRKSGTVKIKLAAGKQLKVEILAYTSMPRAITDPRITPAQRKELMQQEGYEINGIFYPLGEIVDRLKLAFKDIPEATVSTGFIVWKD